MIRGPILDVLSLRVSPGLRIGMRSIIGKRLSAAQTMVGERGSAGTESAVGRQAEKVVQLTSVHRAAVPASRVSTPIAGAIAPAVPTVGVATTKTARCALAISPEIAGVGTSESVVTTKTTAAKITSTETAAIKVPTAKTTAIKISATEAAAIEATPAAEAPTASEAAKPAATATSESAEASGIDVVFECSEHR
jgi:hypothetical protein